MGQVAIVRTITETEFRRTARAIVDNRTRLLLIAVALLIALGPITAVGVLFLPELGERAAAGSLSASGTATVTEFVTGGTALLWLFLVVMSVMRAVTTTADVDEPAFLLLSTSVRNAVVGLVGAEIARFLVWVLLPAVAFAAAFAAGAGTVSPVLVAPLFLVVIIATAVPVGFAVGVWIRHLITAYEPIARYRTLLFAAFWVAYFGVIMTGGINEIAATLFRHLQASPLGWPGHLLLVGVPVVDPSVAAIGGAAVGSLLVVGIALIVGTAGARTHWFADPARTEDDDPEPTGERADDRLTGALSSVLTRPVRTVTVTAIRRTKRSPIRLAYVGYPLLGALGFVQQIIEAGTVPSFMVALFCLYVVWAAGALFTLNPLGDLGPALPAVVTSTLTGRDAIRGRIVAAALVAVPFAALVPLVLGAVSPLSLERTAVLVAGTVIGAVVTPALASGIGSAFPRFGSVSVTNNREAVMPSKTAFLVYTLAIALPAIAAAVLYLEAPETIAGLLRAAAALTPLPDVEVSARAITIGAWLVLVAGLLAPPLSYRYAVERFDWYDFE
ncbi:hypothetical protein A6E15_01835 [Natrinema saccharevitans]|uniref:Uncharacterized protein n=1 Tax=Natrinema saccharevitans TaxID=301967 RepID=A0A1S8ASE3_9EURY|nr:hypothetical protein [Natrinema saccharevitans]OLZ39798.1 hypothetical protein A6E15_01835 [Natrinema saccharevitans]